MRYIKKLWDQVQEWIPKHARGLLLLVVVYNFSVYYMSRVIAGNKHHYDFSLEFDGRIPLVPWTIIIYWGCYLFWIANYILCSRFSKKQAERFLIADIIGKTVCLFFYIFIPTTMSRPQVMGQDLFSWLIRMLYTVDAADNLFPSIHCFVSWMCYIGMRGDQRYGRKYRLFSLFFAIAVCISTLTTRQHVLVDVIAGVALAEISFAITKKVIK